MRKTRVFVEAELTAGGIIAIENEAAHYLDRVLRVREGEIIHVFNGDGGYFEAEILGRRKKSISIRPARYVDDDRESDLPLSLVQGISRGQHMDYTVQKAVELGIRKIVPVFTEFSNVRMEAERARKRTNHWRGVIVSACEQCGRNILPEIHEPVPLQEWIEKDDSPLRFVLHPDSSDKLSGRNVIAGPITLLCGPEGGLSGHELNAALAAGYQPVSLGPRILRTETAAIAAIVQCQTLWGDMK